MKLRTLIVVLVCYLSGNANAADFSWVSSAAFVKATEDESSAWSVATKQTSVAAQQQNDSKLRSQALLASAMGAISMSDRVGRAAISVDPLVGQPSTILCEAQKEAALRVEALWQRDQDSSKLMKSFANSRISSQMAADEGLVFQRKSTYCTISEAKAGACKLVANGMQGWDSNYAGAFSQRTLSPEGELAGYAYAAMVTDVRVSSSIDCQSADCQSASINQMRVAALGTLAAHSLIGQVTDRRIPVLTGE